MVSLPLSPATNVKVMANDLIGVHLLREMAVVIQTLRAFRRAWVPYPSRKSVVGSVGWRVGRAVGGSEG